MVFLFTVAMLSFAYVLTVTVSNNRKLKNLRNQVFDIDEILKAGILYGKAKEEIKEGKKGRSEEGDDKRQRT